MKMDKELQDKDLVSVKWRDATTSYEIPYNDIYSIPLKDLLTVRITTGYLMKHDKDGIILLHDITSEDNCEITVIPNEWILGMDNTEFKVDDDLDELL